MTKILLQVTMNQMKTTQVREILSRDGVVGILLYLIEIPWEFTTRFCGRINPQTHSKVCCLTTGLIAYGELRAGV